MMPRAKRSALARDIARKVEDLNLDLQIASEEGIKVLVSTWPDLNVKSSEPCDKIKISIYDNLLRVDQI